MKEERREGREGKIKERRKGKERSEHPRSGRARVGCEEAGSGVLNLFSSTGLYQQKKPI